MSLAVAVLAGAGVLVGVLENPQCKPDVPRSVRVLFEKRAAHWLSLEKPSAAPPEMPEHWTVAFDGRSLGPLTTTDPGWHSDYAWTYPRDRLLDLAAQDAPTIPNRNRQFGGWCGPPVTRPLVVVSENHVADPARWKACRVPAALREQLFAALKARIDHVEVCVGDSDKPTAFYYSASDLELLSGFKDRRGRRLLAISLAPALNTCDGPVDGAWQPNWYLVGKGGRQSSFIGDGLTLVDAGDYDDDGRSELVFWYSGYNNDGYVLFADDFATRASYLWSYH